MGRSCPPPRSRAASRSARRADRPVPVASRRSRRRRDSRAAAPRGQTADPAVSSRASILPQLAPRRKRARHYGQLVRSIVVLLVLVHAVAAEPAIAIGAERGAGLQADWSGVVGEP